MSELDVAATIEVARKAISDRKHNGLQWIVVHQADRLAELEARVERLLMSRGRKDAQLAVYMSAIASESRKGRTEWARDLLKRADAAALAVKREDLVVAHVNKAAGGDDE